MWSNITSYYVTLLITIGFFHLDSAKIIRDFDDQVSQLIDHVKMPEEKLISLTQLLRTVENTMQTMWPGSYVEFFGSVALDLAFTNSDADISVTLPDSTYIEITDILYKAKLALENEPHYRNVQIFYPSQDVSAIKLYFPHGKIYCDLVFQKKIVVYHTALLKYLLHADERALKLATVLKVWIQSNELAGSKYLSNFNMVLLLIFFLQQRLILPSVAELQENVTPKIISGLDYSNVAFEKKYIITLNNESLYELLGGFFEFYDNFEFGKYIVCPFTGQPLERKLFENVNDVPNIFSLYKISVTSNIVKPLDINALICLQDPLVHSSNTIFMVNNETYRTIKSKLSSAANLYRNTEELAFFNYILHFTEQKTSKNIDRGHNYDLPLYKVKHLNFSMKCRQRPQNSTCSKLYNGIF